MEDKPWGKGPPAGPARKSTSSPGSRMGTPPCVTRPGRRVGKCLPFPAPRGNSLLTTWRRPLPWPGCPHGGSTPSPQMHALSALRVTSLSSSGVCVGHTCTHAHAQTHVLRHTQTCPCSCLGHVPRQPARALKASCVGEQEGERLRVPVSQLRTRHGHGLPRHRP